MKTVILIPARYGSTRLPGKPLAMIAGRTMLQRMVEIAEAARAADPGAIDYYVATDDARITAHCDELGANWLLTPVACPTGTDRAQAAVTQLSCAPDFIVNLQGDAPLTPPDFITAMIAWQKQNPADMVTPVTQLGWAQLDSLRDSKQTTPFSGTTATFDAKTGRAFWFSKNIIPAMRQEAALRAQSPLAPVFRHIGVYGYTPQMLAAYATLPEGRFEALEGLEQLRVLEHGYSIACVPVDYGTRASMSGVDSPEDIARAEALIQTHGELLPALPPA